MSHFIESSRALHTAHNMFSSRLHPCHMLSTYAAHTFPSKLRMRYEAVNGGICVERERNGYAGHKLAVESTFAYEGRQHGIGDSNSSPSQPR